MAKLSPPAGSPTARLDGEKLQMRKWVVKSILESERAYLANLDVLIQVTILCCLFNWHLTFLKQRLNFERT
jgi:hypothetical protein